ncbi:MAG: hypothetical protein GYB65_20225 [Chloroflexi bacterium]|nr:hypothetical protein [Chloroflexota bacterium]
MGYIFLALFGITLFAMYIAIRRELTRTLYIGGLGAGLSIVFVMLFALTQEKTSTLQAIVAGIVVGLGFAGAVVVIAVFFRTNQPATGVKVVSQPTQEEITNGPEDHYS